MITTRGVSTFQVSLMVGALVLGIVGFLMFADVIPSPWGKSSTTVEYGKTVVWGTLPQKVFSAAQGAAFSSNTQVQLVYVEKKTATFDSDLTEALANNAAPDAIIMTQESIARQKDRLSPLGYTARDFKNAFIQEGELFLPPAGPIALPLVVDPLVMYWNRDLFARAGIVQPPVSWTEFYSTPLTNLTVRGASQGTLAQSAFALGEFDNITHAKEILTTLIMQAGSPITAYTTTPAGITTISTVLAQAQSSALQPGSAALQFYTRFADPARTEYSWSRALPASVDFFAQGSLGVYFGFASDKTVIANKNPHLNFDVAPMPQAKNDAGAPGTPATFGKMYAMGVLNAAKNVAGANYAAALLSQKEFSSSLAKEMGVASARRDVLAVQTADPYQDVFNRAALIANGWLDPDVAGSTNAFRLAVEDVLSGRRSPNDAINVLEGRLVGLFPKQNSN